MIACENLSNTFEDIQSIQMSLAPSTVQAPILVIMHAYCCRHRDKFKPFSVLLACGRFNQLFSVFSTTASDILIIQAFCVIAKFYI